MPAPKIKSIFTPIGRLGFSYMDKPDTKPNDKFKPDGKYKGTIFFDDFSGMEAAVVAVAEAAFGKVPVDMHWPWKAVDQTKNERATEAYQLQAKTTRIPEIFDATGSLLPIKKDEEGNPLLDEDGRAVLTRGSFPWSGDECRFKIALVPFEKPETIKERINGKIVETTVTLQGISARLYGVQIVNKGDRQDSGGFDAVDGGYEASQADVRKPRSPANREADVEDTAKGDF